MIDLIRRAGRGADRPSATVVRFRRTTVALGCRGEPASERGQKIHCQARPCTTTPPITGPPRMARPVMPAKMPIARPRCSAPNALPTRDSAAGITIAAPAPWTVRAATSTPMVEASPQAAEARVNTASPSTSVRRRPIRSPTTAAGQQQDGERQGVCVDGPFQIGDRCTEVHADRVECGGDDEGVEAHHERRYRGQRERPAL